MDKKYNTPTKIQILTPQFLHVPEYSAIYIYTIQYIYFSNTISQKPKTVTG